MKIKRVSISEIDVDSQTHPRFLKSKSFGTQLYTFLMFVPIQSTSIDVPANVVVVCETDGRGIFLENSLEGILDACVTTWSLEEDTFAGGL